MAIECRDRRRPVTVPEIEAFIQKCAAVDVHKKVVVSTRGFAETAAAKASQNGITCLTLSEATSFPWCQAPGVTVQEYTLDAMEIRILLPFEAQNHSVAGAKLLGADGAEVSPNELSATGSQIWRDMSFGEETGPQPDETACQLSINIEPPLSFQTDTGCIFPILGITCIFRYHVTEELIPFQLHSYLLANGPAPGKAIYTIANAEMHSAGWNGRIMVVNKEGEGCRVSWVPDMVPAVQA